MKTGTVVLLLLLFGGAIGGTAWFMNSQASITSQQTEPGEWTTVGEDTFCANNPALDLNIRIQDMLSSASTGVSYMNGTVYVKNMDTGSITPITIDVATGAFDSQSKVFDCKSKLGYELTVKTTHDTSNSGEKAVALKSADLVRNPVEVTLQSTYFVAPKVKVYDWENKLDLADTAGSNDYVNIGASTTYNRTYTSGVALTVGTDGFVNYELTLAPQTANRATGKAAMVCLDYAGESDVTDWKADSIEISQDGTALVEKVLSANEKDALSGYEKCYSMVPVGRTASAAVKSITKVKLYMTSGEGINPDYDFKVRFVPLGDIQSSKQPSVILSDVGFVDTSSYTAVGTATAEILTFTIL